MDIEPSSVTYPMNTRRERLTALRDLVIVNLPTEKYATVVIDGVTTGWRQATWFTRNADYTPYMEEDAGPEHTAHVPHSHHPCGTTACVAGMAGMLRVFRAAGLVTHRARGIVELEFGTELLRILDADGLIVQVGKWFGLTDRESRVLFSSSLYDATVDAKARMLERVNHFIEESH